MPITSPTKKAIKVSSSSSSSKKSKKKFSKSSSSSSSSSESSWSSSALVKKKKLEEHQKKRQDRLSLPRDASSPDSSDVSDTETDNENSSSFKQASEFLGLVGSCLSLPPFSASQKHDLLGRGERVNINQMDQAASKILKDENYSTVDLIQVSKKMHEIFGKVALKQKEWYNILLTSKVMPDSETLTREQAEFVISRSFKYIILRHH
jgi:hypothetical protein